MNKNSVIKLHYGGQAVSHCDLKSGEGLKSLWLEIPEYCHLFCSYCFASTNSNENRNCTAKRSTDYLKWDDYKKLLSDFAEAGGKFIGIPGRGEPFHPENLELVKKIINHANDLNLKTTIFTTGETIFFKPEYISQDGEMKVLKTDVEPQFDLMNFLKTKDVVLLIKWNSDNEEVQDRLVNTKNYTKLRAKSLNLLLENEFNRENTPKLGIVTSILKDNQAEIIELYRKYHKGKGLIFDCDTILPRGRGNKYLTENKEVLTHKDLKDIFVELKKEGAILTCQGGTYVGVACDRILHHLYVSITGDVYPCIGCFENGSKKNFKLGNIKSSEGGHENTILKFWQSPIRTKLRTGIDEVFDGVCAKCENFKNKTCYSCLGRYVDEVKREEKDILITTSGCTNHVPNYFEWIIQSEEYFRELLSEPETQRLFKENFENLWEPNRNITFRINQCPEDKRKDFIEHLLIEYKDPHSKGCNDKKCYEGDWTSKFSCIKHYKYSDLNFPMNAVYDFISVPLSFYKDEEYQGSEEKCKNKLVSILSKSLLSNIFLPSMKVLFDKEDEDNNIILCNFLFFNNKEQKYFYRTVSKNDNKFNQAFILFRWAENFGDINYYSSESKGKIFNMSRYFRNKKNNSMYELILGESPNTNHIPKGQRIFLKEILDNDLVREKAENIGNELEDFCNKAGIQQIIETCNKKIFSAYPNDEAVKDLRNFYERLNRKLIQNKSNISDENEKRENILKKFKDLMKKNSQSDKDFIDNIVSEEKSAELINYFIFLRVLRDVLGINHYYLTHSNSYHFLEQNRDSLLRVSGIQPSGMLVCSKEPLKTDLVNKIKIFTETIFSPIDAFYYMDAKKEVLRQATRAAISQVMTRNMSHNLGSHFISNTKNYFNNKAKDFDVKDPDIAKDLRGIKHVMQYMQERMDFIATIVSGDKYPFGLVNFKAQIYDELNIDAKAKRHNATKKVSNFLLKYIVSSEHITKDELAAKDELQLKLIARFPNSSEGNNYSEFDGDCQSDNSSNKGDKLDFSKINIAIPGGVLGRHAFFIIVENIIRNASKHGKSALNKLKSEKKSIEFSILKKKEGFYIYDNKGDAFSENDKGKYLIKVITEKIQNVQILKENEATLDKNDKGIKEIMISALWLNNLNIGDYFSSKEKLQQREDYIKAVAVLDENTIYSYDLDKDKLKGDNGQEVDINNNNNIISKGYNLGYFIKVDDFETIHYIEDIGNNAEIDYEKIKDIKAEIICVEKSSDINNNNNSDSNFSLSKIYPRICYADKKESNPIEIYKEIISDNLNVDLKNTKLFISKNGFSIDGAEGDAIPIITSDVSFKDDDYKNSVSIVFKDHFSNDLKDLKNHESSAFLESISGENFTATIVQKDFLKDEMNRLRVVESSLTPIAIVDERIYRKFKGDRGNALSIDEKIKELDSLYENSLDSFKEKMKNTYGYIYNQKESGIYIYNADLFEDKDTLFKQIEKDFRRHYVDNIEIENIKKYLDKRKIYVFNIEIIGDVAYLVDLVGKRYEFNSNKDTNPFNFNKGGEKVSTRLYPLFASIHLSLIEKIIKETDNKEIKEVMKGIMSMLFGKEKRRFLTIHSGRGNVSEELDSSLKDYSFMSLSAIESCLDNSKYMLSQLFYNTNYYGKGNINK